MELKRDFVVMVEKQKNRVVLIDELRGLCVLLMVIYHGMYDLKLEVLSCWWMCFLRDFFAGVFIVISGVSCNFSKNNVVRGAKCFFVAGCLTFLTWLVSPDFFIAFGILHMLGLSMMFCGGVRWLLKKVSRFNFVSNKLLLFFLMMMFLILFFVSFNVPQGYVGTSKFKLLVPIIFYQFSFLFPLGFPHSSFQSADYFPLVPWLFLFLFGATLGSLKKKEEYPGFMFRRRSDFLRWIGQRALLIYLIHQPILYFLFFVLS